MQKNKKLVKDMEQELNDVQNQLCHEKETINSLKRALAAAQGGNKNSSHCENCKQLQEEIASIQEEKEEAEIMANCAVQKFREVASKYHAVVTQLKMEREEASALAIELQQKEEDIECLKCLL